MQLKDLSITNRKYALNIKADMTSDNILESLSLNDIETNIKGLHALLVTEPNFFLISEDFIDNSLTISRLYNDNFAINKLTSLKELPEDTKEERARNYLRREYFKREFVFSYDDYLELLELDDLLLRETNYHYLLENPYIIYSITYLKKELDDYYMYNKKADNYLYTILKLLLKKGYSDIDSVIAIMSALNLFSYKDNGKIITFAKKI